MTDTDKRFADLERRLAAAEARIAMLESRPGMYGPPVSAPFIQQPLPPQPYRVTCTDGLGGVKEIDMARFKSTGIGGLA
mgnify:CR=1 FL=1|jgi:hypothetical protein